MNANEKDEDTKYCFNCQRHIPLINHVMHTAYCHRNLKLCLKCDEPILTSEYEEHQKSMHSDILCDACSEKLEAIDLESHKSNDCPHRLKTCNYCDIEIEAFEFPTHIDICSSRTERCDDCGQFIILKYLTTHKESHRLKKIPNVSKPILDDSPESLAAYPLLTKKVPNTAVSGTIRTTARTTSMPTLRLNEPIKIINRVSPVKRNNDQPQINTLNNNDNTNKEPKKSTPVITPQSDDEFSIPGAHSMYGNHSTNINNLLKNDEYSNYSSVNVLKGVQLPCEFCQKMVDSEDLVLHETGCRPDLAAFHNIIHSKNKNINSQNNKYPAPPLDLDSSSDSEINLNTLSFSSDDEDSEKTNVEKLPCEFCEELIPLKKLINHQIMCEKLHLDLPKINNLEKEVYMSNTDRLNTSLPKSINNFESKRNLFKQTSVPIKLSSKTLKLRNSDFQLPTSSTSEPQMMQRLPRATLYNRFVNNSARNNYEQFLSKLNHSELASNRDNSNTCLNPSGGAIPKQKSMKSTNNRRVLNNLSKQRNSADSGSSSD